MPKQLKKTFKPKRKQYKKKYKINKGALMDSKINTILEKRMQTIAQKEDNKLNPSLCLRRYCWVDYDPFTNSFRRLASAPQNSMNWDGQMICLSDKIISEDTATMANNPIPNDLNTQLNEAVDRANDGQNILTTIKPSDGRRTGDKIIITGFSLKCRIISDFVRLGDEVNKYDKLKVYIALIKARRNYYSVSNNVETTFEYTPKSLLKINPWGYHSVLDREEEIENNQFRVTTLFRESVTIQSTNKEDATPNIIFRTYSGTFKKPIKINYNPRDVNATRQNNDIYLVVRSSVASTGDEQDVQSQPYCQVCAKLYYKNVK